jgi:uncharacterized protein YndB with AHSA1/START domain
MIVRALILTMALVYARPVAAGAADVIVTEAVVPAPLSEVWQAFTTRAGIESWMVGTGDIDLRIGGLLRTSYQKGADLDGDTAIHQVILSLDPQRMLSYRVVKPPKGFPFADQIGSTWTVVYFEVIDGMHTRVTARMFGYTEDPQSQKMRAFFETGNQATMNALLKRFQRP